MPLLNLLVFARIVCERDTIDGFERHLHPLEHAALVTFACQNVIRARIHDVGGDAALTPHRVNRHDRSLEQQGFQ